MKNPTLKSLYEYINSEDFTREHLTVLVAAILDKEWSEEMEDDLNTLGYNMTVDEFTAWKVDQGLMNYDMHESILTDEIEAEHTDWEVEEKVWNKFKEEDFSW